MAQSAKSKGRGAGCMNGHLRYAVYYTKAGWIGALASENGLLSITFPQPSAQQARETLGERLKSAANTPELFADLADRLTGYFEGKSISFPNSLDLSDATPFQLAVWEAARLIPYGETRSYRWVAERLGKPGAARAVGQALARNSLPIIIPCHRVLAGDGGLGGFSGGLKMKERLLRLEGASRA